MKRLNDMLKKLLTVVLVLNILSLTALATDEENTIEPLPEVTADAYMLISQETQTVLAEHNIDAKIYPASTTKILTAIIVLENAELDDMVTMTDEMYNLIPIGSSHASIDRGETMSVEELLYCLMLPSANEAAIELAYHVGGDLEGFAEMMNEKAVELGATNSNFVNPHGFHDDNHYTTASDMAKITLYACENEKFNEIVNTAQKSLVASNTKSESRIIYTTNHLIFRTSDSRYYEYAKGIKTGYTDAAGYCLVSRAEKGTESLISLVFNAKLDSETNENRVYPETKALFEWGFNNFDTMELLDLSKPMHEIAVTLSVESDYVLLRPTTMVTGLVPINYDVNNITYDYDLPENLVAPVIENQIVGTVDVYYDGEYWGTSELVAINGLELSQVLYYVDIIENFFDSSFFKITVASMVTLLVLGIVISVCKNNARRRKRRRNLARQRAAGTRSSRDVRNSSRGSRNSNNRNSNNRNNRRY